MRTLCTRGRYVSGCDGASDAGACPSDVHSVWYCGVRHPHQLHEEPRLCVWGAEEETYGLLIPHQERGKRKFALFIIRLVISEHKI